MAGLYRAKFFVISMGLGVFGAFGSAAHAQVGTGEGGQCPTTPINIRPDLPPDACASGATGFIDQGGALKFAWETFISLNWPAASDARDKPDATKPFGGNADSVWETMRSKIEVYPGNGSATVPPHGVVLEKGVPVLPYHYDDAPSYVYGDQISGGTIKACPGQKPIAGHPAWINLDETTEIGLNQTSAGALAAEKPGDNSRPELIRYGVKMSRGVYDYAVSQRFWYGGAGSPLATAQQNFLTQLTNDKTKNPTGNYVTFPAKTTESVELKAAWRPLTAREAASGRFHTAAVRYYEIADHTTPCFREAVWGLVGLHVIRFTAEAPWVLWSTFEQADNILTSDGQPVEDDEGRVIIKTGDAPTSPELISDPQQLNPEVKRKDNQPYCTEPGARLHFRENPRYKQLPTAGEICVNKRWHEIDPGVILANQTAHDAIRKYLADNNTGQKDSPWLHYKLINVQPNPFDKSAVAATLPPPVPPHTPAVYYTANAVIETDYSTGVFSGDLHGGAPSDVVTDKSSGKLVPYINTQMLPFQTRGLGDVNNVNMGGCAGCHAFSASQLGQDFSFALGNNQTAPERPSPFLLLNAARIYMQH